MIISTQGCLEILGCLGDKMIATAHDLIFTDTWLAKFFREYFF